MSTTPANYVQIRRARGFRWPKNSQRCDRGGSFGNPFTPTDESDTSAAVRAYQQWLSCVMSTLTNDVTTDSVALAKRLQFMRHVEANIPYAAKIAKPLRDALNSGDLFGMTLMCWCRPGKVCHVQHVLLPFVNGSRLSDIVVPEPSNA